VLKRRIEQMRRLWLVLVLTVLPVLAAALLRWIRIQHVGKSALVLS
jgi:hypothetical protein